MDSKYKLLISNTLIIAIGNILVKVISFFLMPLYTSVMTADQYGMAELLNNTIEIILPLMTLCIIDSLYRFSIDKNTNHSVLFINSFIVIIIGDIIVSFLCLIGYYFLKYKYSFYFLLLYITTTFYNLFCQFARGLGHIKRYALYGVVNSLLLIISNIILLVHLQGGITAYLLSFSIGYGISGFLAFCLSNEFKYIKIKHFNKEKLKEMLQYSLPGIPNMLSWWINSLSDRYIILAVCGVEVTGLYTAASKIPAMVNLITSIFQQAWQYSTAKEIESENNKDFFSNIFRGYTYICTVICGLLILVNKNICKILLKESFYYAWKFVPLLLLAATFGCINTYFGTFYNAVKNNKMLMISTLIGALSNIILNFMLIPFIGGMGAAVATAFSYLIIMIIRMNDVKKFIKIEIKFKKFILQFVLLTISVMSNFTDNPISNVIMFLCFLIIILSDYKVLYIGIKFYQSIHNRA